MVPSRPLWSWQDHYLAIMVRPGPQLASCGPARTTTGKLWSGQDHNCQLWSGQDHNWQVWSGQDHNWQLWSGQDHNWQLWSGQDHNWQVVVRPGPQVPKKLKHKRAWSCTLLLVCFRPAHTYFGTTLDLCTLLLCELVMLQQLWSG